MMKKTLLLGTITITMFGAVFSQDQSVLRENSLAEIPVQIASKTGETLTPYPSIVKNANASEETVQKKVQISKETAKNDPESEFEGKQTVSSDSERNKFELYAGYSGASLCNFDACESPEHGFNVSGVYYFHRYIGAKVDVSGTYKSFEYDLIQGDHSLHNVTGGVQFKDSSRVKVLKPFAHILFGVGVHRDKYAAPIDPYFEFDFNGFSTVVGGGLDIRVHPRIDIRVIQADLNTIYYKEPNVPSSIYINFRFGAGIVFNF